MWMNVFVSWFKPTNFPFEAIILTTDQHIPQLRFVLIAFQDKNVWLSVIDVLKKNDKMPAVAFIFSKKRIEETAEHLGSVDLIDSQKDRSHIHTFFENSINLLKGSDKKLPQVLRHKYSVVYFTEVY